jgi:hypothetical protein
LQKVNIFVIVVVGMGDTGVQLLASGKWSMYDPKRSARMTVIGACLIGPHVY